jgi:poly(A) polymerase
MATIGDPEIRMREDPVRALRAVRFAARLGFAIAPDTFEAMRRHAGELARCAPARVLEEIFKLLRCGGSARAFALLKACGALPVILPALGAAHEKWDDGQRRSFIAHLGALDRLVRSGAAPSEVVLLGALLMHLGSPGQGEAPAAVTLLDELVQTSRLPRKVAEGIRLALQAQRTFREPRQAGGRRRRRGRGPAGQHWFTDALQLLQITVEATGEGLDVLNRWRAEAVKAPPGRHDDEGADGDLEPERPTARPAADPEARPDGPVRERPPRGGHRESPRRPPRHEARTAPRNDVPRHGDTEALPAGGAGAVVEVGAGDAGDELEEVDEVEVDGVETTVEAGSGAPSREGAGPAGSAGSGKKRRRRGGRRRRRRGAGGGAGGSGGAPPTSGAVE